MQCKQAKSEYPSARVHDRKNGVRETPYRLRTRPETYSVFSEPCVRGPGSLRETWRQWRRVSSRSGRRDAGASQGRLDAPGREHKAPVGRAGRGPLRRRRLSTMLQHRLRPVSWRGPPSNSLKTRYMSPDGLSTSLPVMAFPMRPSPMNATRVVPIIPFLSFCTRGRPNGRSRRYTNPR
jgi:hypothetical protein